nr:MAG TPA_asm: hypothetical protein [Bacteriophage sp.]
MSRHTSAGDAFIASSHCCPIDFTRSDPHLSGYS